MEEQLIADLRGTTALAAKVAVFNGRPAIDWVRRPDLAGLPAITLQRVSTDRLYTQDGPVELTGARVQFDCWAGTYGEARNAFRALLDKMESGGTGWKAFLDTERDADAEDLDGGQRVFRVSADFNIWYKD